MSLRSDVSAVLEPWVSQGTPIFPRQLRRAVNGGLHNKYQGLLVTTETTRKILPRHLAYQRIQDQQRQVKEKLAEAAKEYLKDMTYHPGVFFDTNDFGFGWGPSEARHIQLYDW